MRGGGCRFGDRGLGDEKDLSFNGACGDHRLPQCARSVQSAIRGPLHGEGGRDRGQNPSHDEKANHRQKARGTRHLEALNLFGTIWLLIFLIVLWGNIVQGMTGFGAALISGPLLAIFLDPKLVVVIILVTGMSNFVLVASHARRHIDYRRLLPLVVTAVPGIPLGSYLLMIVTSLAASLLIAMVSIIFSILLLLGYSRRFKREAVAACCFGFTSGIFTAAVAMGGPPIVIFLANQGWAKEVFRATVAYLFLITTGLCLVSHLFTGVTTGARLLIGTSLIPAGILGFYLGNALFRKISSALFIKLALFLILLSGLTSMVTNSMKI